MLYRSFARQTFLLLIGSFALYPQTVQPRQLNHAARQTTAVPPTRQFNLGAAPKADLGPIDDSIRDKPSPRRGVPRIAVHRSLEAANLAQGTWQNLADGSAVWRLAIQSQSALGLRLHFTNFSVGAGQVWVHDTATPAAQTFGPYTGSGRNGKGDFWTEAVFSDAIEVEYKPAPATGSSGLPPFAIPELIHLWRVGPFEAPRANSLNATSTNLSAFSTAANVQTEATNYSCFLDATCYQNNPVVFNGSHATAMILFSDYQCSATILNAPNQAPLLLTAGHCINNQTDAAGMEALFDFRTTQCGQNANLEISQQYLNSLPYSLGQNLLAFANLPYLDGTSATEIQNDIDYSLIQLDGFPTASDVILSGYTVTDLAVGDSATSLSHPLTEFMKVAFGSRAQDSVKDGTSFVNAYEIDQSSSGRVDEGSSGSGIFDKNGYLVGLLSTADSCLNPMPDGSCPATSTACDIPAPFDGWYTKFSSIYPAIATYLNQPLSGTASNPSAFRANPNPIYVTDGSGLGITTFYINYPGATEVQIHVGSVNGPLLYDGPGVGTSTTGKWVIDGLVFYLQDVSNGKLLISDNTIATVTISLGTVSLSASPASIPEGTLGITTVTWSSANSPSGVDVYVGDTSGPAILFVSGSATGSAQTGLWARAGTTFYLEDAITHAILETDTIQASSTLQTQFTATPNPIITSLNGTQLGQTTVAWNAPAGTAVQVRLASPDGPLFAAGGGVGAATTGLWVTNGLTFYLQNVTNGLPLTAANTLATTTVYLTPE